MVVDDAAHAEAVVALWALLGAARAEPRARMPSLAAAARDAIGRARGGGGGNHLLLAERAGSLLVDGRRLRPSLAGFAAARGVADCMRSCGVSEVLFDGDVDAESLWSWAVAMAAGTGDAAEPARGVHQSRADDARPSAPRGAAQGESPSRLPAVFLQHRLRDALAGLPGIRPAGAMMALALVVERLQAERGGIELLQRLSSRPGQLDQALIVAVVAVLILRGIGWPSERLADAGVAALLHDYGRGDAHESDWAELLLAGEGDHWLQWGIVARTWREASVERDGSWPLGAEALALLVRFAVVAASAAGGDVAPRTICHRAARICGLDDDFAAAAAAALAAC